MIQFSIHVYFVGGREDTGAGASFPDGSNPWRDFVAPLLWCSQASPSFSACTKDSRVQRNKTSRDCLAEA